MLVLQAIIFGALVFSHTIGAEVDIWGTLIPLLADVDCTGLTGFRAVGFLAFSYKDCIYVVCDDSNPDPDLRKYPRACGGGFQTSEELNTPGDDLFFPPSCASMGLTVEQCIAVSSGICRVEVSTTDGIDCGPTYKDLKESSQLAATNVDLEYKNPYCAHNDPHMSQPLLNNDTELCVRPTSNNANDRRYRLFHRDALSNDDIVEIDGLLSGGGGHYIRKVFIRVATGTLNVTVDGAGVLHVDEDISSGEPTVTYLSPEGDSHALVITISFLSAADGGKIVVTLRGRAGSRMNMCIYDPLNIISHDMFGSSMLDPTSYFGYIENLDGIIVDDLANPGEHLLEDYNSDTYEVDTPMVNHTFRVNVPIHVSCWHISNPFNFINMADFIV